MTDLQVKELLTKQLQLLSEKSQIALPQDLASTTAAMVSVVDVYLRMRPSSPD